MLAKGKGKMTIHKRILDNLGIRIDLSEIPEYMTWQSYVYPRISFIGKLRRFFFRHKVHKLNRRKNVAVLNRVLELGNEKIIE